MAVLLSTDRDRRRGARGEITTPHGVGAHAGVHAGRHPGDGQGLQPETVRATGADILLGNTYHLMLRPGAERIAALGGLHTFMNWPHPILTDSGGFQVMSLSELRKIERARRHLPLASRRRDGRAVAGARGRDPEPARRRHRHAARRMHQAAGDARRDRARHAAVAALGRALQARVRGARAPGRALFGIVQGGDDPALRVASARALDRYRLSRATRSAGLRSASRRRSCCGSIDETAPALPADRPRYLMGVGTPEDLLEAVARGIDMFDCVMPTRNGRHGVAFTRFGADQSASNARHADDPRPLDEESPCAAARDLFARLSASSGAANEMLGAMLLSAINLAYYQELMAGMRAAIARAPVRASSAPRRARRGRAAILPPRC